MASKNIAPARTLSRAKILIFSLIPTIVLLITGEVILRVWVYYFRTSYERYDSTKGRLALVPNIRFIRANGDEFLINSKGFVGPEFENRKPKEKYRIFALGDSCTFGTGHWERAYPNMLERLLNSVDSQQQFEVINAGIEGYNSGYALARLKEDILQYDPDMVIIYIGWNDLMKINPNNLSTSEKYTWFAVLMQRSYLMRGFNKLIFFHLRPLIIRPKLTGSVSEKYAFDSFTPTSFRDNLKMMIEILQRKQIKTMLLTLPTAVRTPMTYDELEKENIVFPYYAGTYSIDKFLSLHRSYNNVIHKIAITHNIPLIDLDTIFNKYNKSGLFFDTMHPTIKGHSLIAESIMAKMKKNTQ